MEREGGRPGGAGNAFEEREKEPGGKKAEIRCRKELNKTKNSGKTQKEKKEKVNGISRSSREKGGRKKDLSQIARRRRTQRALVGGTRGKSHKLSKRPFKKKDSEKSQLASSANSNKVAGKGRKRNQRKGRGFGGKSPLKTPGAPAGVFHKSFSRKKNKVTSKLKQQRKIFAERKRGRLRDGKGGLENKALGQILRGKEKWGKRVIRVPGL